MLRFIVGELGRYAPRLERRGLLFEPGDPVLIHHRQPEVPLHIGFEIEHSGGKPRSGQWHGVLGDRAALRIEPSKELFAEIGKPHRARFIDDDVVRLDRFPRKVVLRDDDTRGVAHRTRERLERIRPGRACVQVDACQVLGQVVGARAEAPHQIRRAHAPLRVERKALVRIARHPLENPSELVHAVRRSERSLECVAVRAAEELFFLVLRARNACEPFRVGELRTEVRCLAQRQVGRCSVRADVDRRGPFEIVSDRANPEGVMAWYQSRRREAVAPLIITHHGRRDCGSVGFDADQHAFHRAVICGLHLAAQREPALVVQSRHACRQLEDREDRCS